jgi:hypothetical protein
MAQTWNDLLFAHWPIPAADLAPLIPAPLELDLWHGGGYIAVVPFRMDGIRPRGTFPVPWLSSTPEINVRTYVRHKGRSGVYFFSLDAANRIAVRIARRFFHLPYVAADMDITLTGESVEFSTQRPGAEFRGSYAPSGETQEAQPGTLEHWLMERYCFFTLDRAGTVFRGDIDHKPWPLQPASASIEVNTMTAPTGIVLPADPPLLHFARRIDVVAWLPEPA